MKIISVTTFCVYIAAERLEGLFKQAAATCNSLYWRAKELHWRSKMPHNVRIGEMELPNYYCPFCDNDLDYAIDFDGILNGVCWKCGKAWRETWDNSDCPDFDN